MSNIKTVYAASSNLTITLASLASDANLLAGRESTWVDNSSNLYLDYLLAGTIMVGTTPTTLTEIRVYVAGLINDTLYPDVLDGTDSAETITSAGIRDSVLKLAAILPIVPTASNVAQYFGPISVASLFGGVVPLKFGVFVVHNTGAALNATGGNHIVSVTPIYESIV